MKIKSVSEDTLFTQCAVQFFQENGIDDYCMTDDQSTLVFVSERIGGLEVGKNYHIPMQKILRWTKMTGWKFTIREEMGCYGVTIFSNEKEKNIVVHYPHEEMTAVRIQIAGDHCTNKRTILTSLQKYNRKLPTNEFHLVAMRNEHEKIEISDFSGKNMAKSITKYHVKQHKNYKKYEDHCTHWMIVETSEITATPCENITTTTTTTPCDSVETTVSCLIDEGHVKWAAAWINYPSNDCQRLSKMGMDELKNVRPEAGTIERKRFYNWLQNQEDL